jgi:hypothetical protein
MWRRVFGIAAAALAFGAGPSAVRFPQGPLITQQMSPKLGDNINGPSIIQVPSWVARPLGRYYLYFAHHKGSYIRLAYADNLAGPWKIYDPGVLNVKDTEFYRQQPDPPALAGNFYTHVASPEVVIDEANKRLVMLVHGWYTAGERWPEDPREAARWSGSKGYAQLTQTAVSTDGLHFSAQPGVTARTSYERVFRWQGTWYSMGRLGVLGRAAGLSERFELGPNPFAGVEGLKPVRHVATILRGDRLYVFFSSIGDAPEQILFSTVALNGDWKTWKATAPVKVLHPETQWECAELPVKPSKAGEAEGPENALRDPAVIEDGGRVVLFYSYCGEQGLAAADVTALVR